jgi:ubiquinone/menaquinone biosynthesis C-methylase UbiE
VSGGGQDKWATWLLEGRDGGDPEQRAKSLEHLLPIRDRILENAGIRPGESVLDVGGGDGLIAFGALDRVGDAGKVILADISADLVAYTSRSADDLGVADRMSFVVARAEGLEPIRDRSVDVVTTRSVLIYVDDKAAAFRAFHRVLRPLGRFSIFEPINNYFPWDPTEFWGFDTTPVSDLVEKVWSHEGWGPDTDAADPMMNFSERDLVRSAEEAGFIDVHADLRVDVESDSWVLDWDRLMGTTPNPNASSVGDSIRGALTDAEATRLESHLRPLVDAGKGVLRSAFAYVWGSKRP